MSDPASDLVPASGYQETPVFLDTAWGEIFGIVTHPSRSRGRTAVIVLPGGGTPLTINQNRVSVRLCRSLASLGFTAFRMDYHGTGESSGSVEQFHLEDPFVPDVMAAVARLKGFGLERFVLVGATCFGARTALAAAAEIEEVDEVVALATPLRGFAMGERHSMNAAMRRSLPRYVLEAFRPRTIRGLLDQRSRRIYRKHAQAKLRHVRNRAVRLAPWSAAPRKPESRVSPRLMETLDRLSERRVPMLFVYGSDEDYYNEFLAASDNELAGILARAGSLLRVALVPGRVHGLVSVSVQDAVVDLILDWATGRIEQADPATIGHEGR